MINNYMRAHNDNPTDKMKKNLKKQPLHPAPANECVEIDLNKLINEILNDATKAEVNKTVTKRIDSEEVIIRIKAILSEYFDSFMLMGYDVNGKRVVLRHAKTNKDEDSLMEMIRYIFIRMVQGE